MIAGLKPHELELALAREENKQLRALVIDLVDELGEMKAAHLRADPHAPEACTNCGKAQLVFARAGRVLRGEGGSRG